MQAREYDAIIKLLLIGDSGVGKSCLLMRFAEGCFSESYITTIGIDFKIRTIEQNGKRLKLQIWDTAGQERFRTITTAYYRGAMGILLVYDVSNRNSFYNIKNWLRQVDTHAAENVIRIIIGNKSCIDSDAREVTPEEGLALADEYQVDFFETSAKNDINVDDAFGLISRRIMERLLEDEGKAAVSSRVKIRPDMRKKKPGIGVAAAVGMVVVAPFALVAAPFYFGYKAAASTTASCQEAPQQQTTAVPQASRTPAPQRTPASLPRTPTTELRAPVFPTTSSHHLPTPRWERAFNSHVDKPKLEQHWSTVKWADKPACVICATVFSRGRFARQHHCRDCGECVCDGCSPHRVALPDKGYLSPVRMCSVCKGDRAARRRRQLTALASSTFSRIRDSREPFDLRTIRYLEARPGLMITDSRWRPGEFSIVHKGTLRNDESQQRPIKVAIKAYAEWLASDESAGEEVAREVTLLRQLSHPNILELVETNIATDDASGIEFPYFCSVLYTHGTLLEALESSEPSALTWGYRCRVLLEIAEAERYLHTHVSMMHNDLKAENVLIASLEGSGKATRVKIFDFNTSRPIANGLWSLYPTPTHQAPEIHDRKPWSDMADVFSFGILIAEVMLRKHELVFSAIPTTGGIFELGKAYHDGVRPPIPEVFAEELKVNPTVEKLIGIAIHCWAHEPSERWRFPEIISNLRKTVVKDDAEKARVEAEATANAEATTMKTSAVRAEEKLRSILCRRRSLNLPQDASGGAVVTLRHDRTKSTHPIRTSTREDAGEHELWSRSAEGLRDWLNNEYVNEEGIAEKERPRRQAIVDSLRGLDGAALLFRCDADSSAFPGSPSKQWPKLIKTRSGDPVRALPGVKMVDITHLQNLMNRNGLSYFFMLRLSCEFACSDEGSGSTQMEGRSLSDEYIWIRWLGSGSFGELKR